MGGRARGGGDAGGGEEVRVGDDHAALHRGRWYEGGGGGAGVRVAGVSGSH